MNAPETLYTRTGDGLHIAYQVVGSGPIDILYVPNCTVVNTAGDGFLVAFDGPARAIRCAAAIVGSARSLGMEVRAGLHTGECEVRGDDLAGIAVHIGARIVALAGAREVLVTSTVRDLAAGSGIAFADRGQHELKGVPGTWQVLAVQL